MLVYTTFIAPLCLLVVGVDALRSQSAVQFEQANDSYNKRPDYLRYLFPRNTLSRTPHLAKQCNQTACRLPKCLCSDTKAPGTISPIDVPQMVVFTFQGAISDQNYELYQRLFNGRRNPNGCPTTGTFFVSHEWTNYYQVQSLYSQGHEIADRGITEETEAYWRNASSDIWAQQIKDQASILHQFGGVPSDEVRGFRSPGLFMGGDNQMAGEQKANMSYDASRASVQYSYPLNPGFMWPYTYDYASIQDCVYGICPTESYPGLWQVPLIALHDKNGHACTPLQACQVDNERDVFYLLWNAFQEHAAFRRAPLVLTVDTAWLLSDFKMKGTLAFLDTVLSFQKEVYVVSAWKALQWIQQPTPISALPHFASWSCGDLPRPVCDPTAIGVCFYDNKRRQVQREGPTVTYRLRSCKTTCPKCYPWLGDAQGISC